MGLRFYVSEVNTDDKNYLDLSHITDFPVWENPVSTGVEGLIRILDRG